MPRKVKKASRRKHKTFILVLDKDDPEKELEFELDFQASMTTQERFTRMVKSSREFLTIWRRNGYQKPTSILKRS